MSCNLQQSTCYLYPPHIQSEDPIPRTLFPHKKISKSDLASDAAGCLIKFTCRRALNCFLKEFTWSAPLCTEKNNWYHK